MDKFKKGITNKYLWIGLALILSIVYVISRSLEGGNDINVYLFASKQFYIGENIYTNNPYNPYLYSPFFALILRPLLFFEWPMARLIWALFNLFLAIRLGQLIFNLVKECFVVPNALWNYWAVGLGLISLGYLNENILLGQITIVILWLTLEALIAIVYRQKHILGAFLLALGISIKVIPIIGLFYLFFKGRYKSIVFCVVFVSAFLLLPSVLSSHEYNLRMLHHWVETINPTNDKYVFENDDGVHSLNALLPAYFFNFKDVYTPAVNLKRQIISVPHTSLVVILQGFRVLLLLVCVSVIFAQHQRKENQGIHIYYELSFITLVSALIFPHQPYYAMLYCIPAAAYILLYIVLSLHQKDKMTSLQKSLLVIACAFLLLITIKGRDILGDRLVSILNYYHFESFVNLFFLGYLLLIKPKTLFALSIKLKGGK